MGTLESFPYLLLMKRRKFKQPYKDRLYRRQWNKTPRGRYTEQRKRAVRRGIAWEFTFETWWKLWQESGHWNLRGKKAGCYVMARRGDTGPYSPGNCVIVQLIVNAQGSAVTAGIIRPEHAPEALPFADVPF